MAVCMVFTLLPMNNMRAMADESWTEGLQADEAGTEGYNEGGDEAKTASGPAITMITDGAVEYYDLWVGGIQVTSENKDNITGSGIEKGTVTYDPDNCILTLNGATIKGSKSDEISGTIYKYGIWFWGYLKINLMGSNEIIDESGSNTISYGIYTTHTLTITGSGSLNVSVSTTGSTSLCYGIKGTTGTIITIIDGGNINVSVQSDGDATGICGDNVTISGGIVTSNATTASSEVDFVNAIYAEKNINISGGTVIATGTKMNGSYPAAYGFGGSNVNITGGTVTAKAYGYNGNSDIAAVNAKFTFSNGSVKAGTDSDGSVLNDYDNTKLSKYRYLSYEISPEAASVNEAKRVIEGGIYTMAQEDAGTSESVREGLARHINGLSAMRETGIAVTADDITINYYTSAIAGTSDSPAGKDGSFIFTVSLSNEGATATTAFIRGTIIATAYAGLTDDQAVADAKEIIERATYTMIQSVANTVESARRELAEQINGLSGMDETEIIVTEKDITIESFTPAEEGTSTNLAGIDGIFTFTVKLNKGRETATTESIEVTITATAYTGLTDEEAVAAAMEIVVGGTVAADYDADQEAKTAAVQKYVNGLLTGDLAEVTAVVSHSGNNSYMEMDGKVTSPVSGYIAEIGVEEGNITGGTEKVAIAVDGCCIQIYVTKEKAERIEPGDELMVKVGKKNESIAVPVTCIGEMNDEGKVEITGIMPEGEYSIGTEVIYELTKKTKEYRMTIPITALHSDANGNYYVLVPEENNTVLGDELVARKIAVTVIDKSDTAAAVDGSLYSVSIISGSNKNIEEGDRVRCVEDE